MAKGGIARVVAKGQIRGAGRKEDEGVERVDKGSEGHVWDQVVDEAESHLCPLWSCRCVSCFFGCLSVRNGGIVLLRDCIYCVPWLTYRLALILYFTIPRAPHFVFYVPSPFNVDNSTIAFSRTPANYSFSGSLNLYGTSTLSLHIHPKPEATSHAQSDQY
jgi:hypothetical protein